MKRFSTRTLSLTFFLFILYNNLAYIFYFFFDCNSPFVIGNLVAMAQVGIGVLLVVAAFYWPRYFWGICAFYFLTYPIEIFVLDRWFPTTIYVEDLTSPESIGKNLGIPIILLVLSAITYGFVYRDEKNS